LVARQLDAHLEAAAWKGGDRRDAAVRLCD
jgi:hypothetical protein